MKKINIFITIVASVLFNSCATYHPQYTSNYQSTDFSDTGKEIEKTFYLIGDAGYIGETEKNLSLQSFKQYIAGKNTKNDHLLFLGNSFYPAGMPEDDGPEKALAKKVINKQLEAIKGFQGTVNVLPGNLDWKSGVDGLEREEDLLKEAFNSDSVLEPNNGCPLEEVELSDAVHLIMIDTQWYIENWNKHPKMNDKCQIKNRDKFLEELEGELKKAKQRTIVLAMYHPLYTNGKYGGNYPAWNHLLPVPGLASLITQVRSQGAISPQDRFNESYHKLMSRIEVLVKDHENLVLVSGHDQSLQYIEGAHAKQVVAGSGGGATAAAIDENGLFSYGGQGFAKLTIYKDRSTAVTFFKAEKDGSSTKLFEKEIIQPEKTFDTSKLPKTFPKTVQSKVYADSLVNRSGFFKALWGDHYRSVYGKEVMAPTVDLDTLYGGLTAERAGGGHQTVSLRLVDKEGHDYNMRTLKKSAVQFLQTVILKNEVIESDFRNTLPEDLILDFYTAAHPYGAFAIPKLADAANVFHTNPKLFYVPKQKALGNFNETYGDALYMIVERPDEEYDGPLFDYAEDIISTDDVLEEIRDDEENKINQKAYIRARLFDMLIGDWDRHNDQWRFALQEDEEGNKIYTPIPRDRDQVFANFDGGLLDIARTLISATRQFQVYGPELKHTKWFNSAGIKLDRALAENYGREEWLAQAEFIKKNVTDTVIEQAFKDLPKAVQDETSEKIIENLKGRRDNIVKIASEYYDYFSNLQIITGTDKDDIFEITRLPNGKTNVKAYRNKGGDKADLIIDRTYAKDDTKELWIYGLDDDDLFKVKGKGERPIFIRIIGGQNHDTYDIENGSRIKVYDQKAKKNTIKNKGGAAFRITNNYNFNTYNYIKENKTTNLLLPAFGYNADDGFLLGLTDTFTVHGFQENPFKQKHSIKAGYYFATKSFDINYSGEFANIFGDWNFLAEGHYRSPNFSENFFGFGNETENFDDDLGKDYNRVRIGSYGGALGIKKDGRYGSTFTFKAKFEGVEVEGTNDRFISDIGYPDADQRKYFASAEGTYTYESYDNKANPKRGMLASLTAGGTQNLDDSDRVFGYLTPKLGFYNALTNNKKLVLNTKAFGHFNIGNNFEFYQGAQLGRDYGLRGYRRDRFTGRSALAGGADLRYSFNSFNTAVTPLQIGVFGGYDIGRVWIPNDTSNVWHDSYGGGFWINAADLLSGTVNIFTGDEGVQFSFKVAFSM
ncbi:phosphoesterase [Marixanthomonas spongiae]|uniref:Phosphoesterase n=1 Tax=Marixanthomonas spongiae TaxID=2174845 RepID=A0A2U0I3X8_9FLAO|nr:phosphoesterase [Marixanthomonas spongiae]PVW15774.1 phosphoesterase [Marixanthomonas spongiae]